MPVAGLLILAPAYALATEIPNKSQYHLFNPVPREQMRALVTDRPDKRRDRTGRDAFREAADQPE
jgi:hypothetical protein